MTAEGVRLFGAPGAAQTPGVLLISWEKRQPSACLLMVLCSPAAY